SHAALLQLSLAYYRANLNEESIRAAEEANLLSGGSSANAFNNICAAYNQLGRYDKAVEACKSALTFAPDHSLAQANLAYALSKTR
ncbi:MAG: hypothetical protein ACLGPL_06530, partial [Acidobacteriota bacterium]